MCVNLPKINVLNKTTNVTNQTMYIHKIKKKKLERFIMKIDLASEYFIPISSASSFLQSVSSSSSLPQSPFLKIPSPSSSHLLGFHISPCHQNYSSTLQNESPFYPPPPPPPPPLLIPTLPRHSLPPRIQKGHFKRSDGRNPLHVASDGGFLPSLVSRRHFRRLRRCHRRHT